MPSTVNHQHATIGPSRALTAFVISDVVGQKAGAYLATWLLCRELKELGVDVTCFAQHESWDGVNKTGEIKVTRPWLRKGCRWDWPGRCLAWQARRAITQIQPDYVFVMGVTPLARYLLESQVAEHLLVWELTNANVGNKFVDPIASRLLDHARAVLAPSATIERGIRETYRYSGTILRLPFWIEDEQKSYAPPPAEFHADFMYLGRRDVEKGLNELIRATAVVAQQFPGIRVVIAGQGSKEPFATLAHDLGVAANITFTFFMTRAETMTALSRSRCLVLPSYHEGYPLVLLEAAQLSVPFIATRVGSVAEVFEETDAGLIVPPHSPEALAEAMLTMLLEPPIAYAERRVAAQAIFNRLSSKAAIEAASCRLLEELTKPGLR